MVGGGEEAKRKNRKGVRKTRRLIKQYHLIIPQQQSNVSFLWWVGPPPNPQVINIYVVNRHFKILGRIGEKCRSSARLQLSQLVSLYRQTPLHQLVLLLLVERSRRINKEGILLVTVALTNRTINTDIKVNDYFVSGDGVYIYIYIYAGDDYF